MRPAIFCLPLHINHIADFVKQVVLFTGKTRKKSLANGVGCFRLATRLRSRYKRIELYLKPHELELFRSKASGYHSLADMIRDAVTQHNDLGSLRKMEAMNELYSFYQRFQQELGWLGGNFNQVVKRANELALSGELSQDYLDSVIIPQTQKVIPLLESIKAEHQRIAKKIIKI